MNLHFYPRLLAYQGGSTMAALVANENIDADSIYKFTERYTWALDFYNQNPVNISSLEALKTKKDIWVYTDDKELLQLKKAGITWDKQHTVDQV